MELRLRGPASGPRKEALPDELIGSQESVDEQEEEGLYCFFCFYRITSSLYRRTIQGGHEHTFTNPGGYVYRIGCFRKAPGCVQVGDFSNQFSWFHGYTWRYALCAGCRLHLGWAYDSSRGGGFYGLILDRLVSQPG